MEPQEHITIGAFFQDLAASMGCNTGARDHTCFTAGVLAAVAIFDIDALQLQFLRSEFEHGWPSGVVSEAVDKMRRFLDEHPLRKEAVN